MCGGQDPWLLVLVTNKPVQLPFDAEVLTQQVWSGSQVAAYLDASVGDFAVLLGLKTTDLYVTFSKSLKPVYLPCLSVLNCKVR